MLKFLLSVAALAAVTSSQAITWKYGSFHATYKTCKLTGWGGNQPTSGKLTVPSTYTHTDGVTYTVNAIASNALDNLTEVTQITIPSTIRYIGKINSSGGLETNYYGTENFSNCPKLATFKVDSQNKYFTATDNGLLVNKDQTVLYRVPAAVTASSGKLTLPDKIETITDGTFSGNTSISNLTISQPTFRISSDAGFHEMPKLTTIKVASGNQYYAVKDGMLIDKGLKKIVAYPPARTTKNIEITSSPETIGENAFANTQYAKTITLPETITRIADGAFAGSSMTTVNLPQSLAKMGKKVFFSSNLLTATIPSGCTIREADHVYTFASCPQLKSITIKSEGAHISQGFARDCPKLESVSFTHTPGEIRDAAFKNCPSLTSFPFSATIDMLGDSIFVNTGFEKVVFDNANAVDYSTGDALFANCKNLRLIDISAIGLDNEDHDYWFSPQMISYCPLLTEIRLPRVTNFSHRNSSPNIGPSVPLAKLVIGNFYIWPAIPDGIVHYYGGNTYTPETYVKTTDTGIDSWIDGSWPLRYLYTGANGAKVAPIFYCDAINPAEDYVAKDATYYVPGRCAANYSEAAEEGCTVREMFSIRSERKPSPSGVNKDALYLYLTSENPTFKLLSYDICDQKGESAHMSVTGNDIVTPINHDDIKWIMLVYTINGEEMKTRYTIAELENSAIGDIAAAQASMSLIIDGNTMYISGSTANAAFSVINVNGAEVLRGTGSVIDLSSLASGTYIIRATDSGNQITDKFHI